MEATLENVKVFLAKVGTVVADRRFWVAVATVLLVVGYIPSTVDPEVKADELMATALVVMQVVGAVVTAVSLTASWGKRPPSGKSFKIPQGVQIISEAIVREINENKGK